MDGIFKRNHMKRLLSIAFLFFILLPVSAQEMLRLKDKELQAAIDQIDVMAESLCSYIMAVGSSRSSVSDETKDDIINNKVPKLFWNYWEDPRMMKTTGGLDGSIVYSKPMYNYFRNLKRQARQGINREVRYELTYDRVYADENLSDLSRWEKMPDLPDGCHMWRNSIRIDQKYFVIDYALNHSEKPYSGKVSKAESDSKYFYVYFITKPKGEGFIKIGDVYMAVRTETFDSRIN